MKNVLSLLILAMSVCLLSCGGASTAIQLGDCPLTVVVRAEGDEFDGYANIYLDGYYLGTTDAKKRSLSINLQSGEYDLLVTADGYESWESSILMLGKEFKQNALATLRKELVFNPSTGGE
jgi:hypothetical protein